MQWLSACLRYNACIPVGAMMRWTLAQNALITLLSRMMGFGRDLLFARVLGVSPLLDAFLVAFRLPNIFRRLLAEGVFMQAMIPAVVASKSPQEFKRSLLTMWLMVLAVVSFPFMYNPEAVLTLFAPGLDVNTPVFAYAVEYMPWVFPYLCFVTICGFYTVQLNLVGHLWVASALPLVLNGCLIIAVVYWPMSLAKAVFVAGFLQLVFCVAVTRYEKGVVLPGRPKWSKDCAQMLTSVTNGFSAQLVTYLSSCMDLVFLSFLATGSVSMMYYAERLMQMPLGIFAVTIANVYAPYFSRSMTDKNHTGFMILLSQALEKSFILALPSMVGLFMIAPMVMEVMYGSGHEGAMQSSQALQGLALAMPAYMFMKVFVAAAFSQQRSQVIMKYALHGLGLSLLVTVSLLTPLGMMALVVAAIVSAWYQCWRLYQSFSEGVDFNKERLLGGIVSTISLLLWLKMLGVLDEYCLNMLIEWLLFKIMSSIIVYDQMLRRFDISLVRVFAFVPQGEMVREVI